MGWFTFTTGITPLAEYSSNQTIVAATKHVLVDASSGDVTITLEAATSGAIHTIKKIDNSNHKVIVDGNGNETIDGELTVELNLQYQYVTLVSDGTEWFIIGGEYVKMEDTLNSLLSEQEDSNALMQKLVILMGKLEKHWAEERETEYEALDIQEDIEDEFKKVITE